MALTTSQYIAKLECFKKTLEANRPLAIAALSVHQLRAKRIFTDGKNSQGSLIGKSGYNDNKEIYVNPKNSPKGFKTQGKPFEFRGKGGKLRKTVSTKRNKRDSELSFGEQSLGGKFRTDHTTRWFSSYKAFREFIGRRVDIVNLTLSGNLKSNFENQSRGSISVKKINNNEYQVGLDAENAKKKEWLEEHYNSVGLIFNHSQEEKKEFYRIIALELNNEFSKC